MPKGKPNLLQRLASRLTWWQHTVAALVVVVGGAWSVDAYFAKSSDLTALATEVAQSRLKSDRRALRAEETTLLSIPEREKRALTQYEQQRLKEVQEELRDVDREMEQRRKK